MFLATIDKTKRLLLLSYIGQVRAEELRQAVDNGPALLADLPTGMRVLADFDRMESMDAETAVELGRMMEMCDRKGVEMIARVIPDPSKDIGLNILAAFHYRKRLPAVTCCTMQEAMEALGI